MCRMVRELSPESTIVVGGHVAAIPGVEHMLDADHIVKGDGIEWMRRYLGEDPAAPVRHPALSSGFDLRVMGVKVPDKADTSATIIASVGCPMGCNFCTTSAFFGGKGKLLNWYPTGEDLFRLMEEAETSRNVRSFFIMDENFLLQRQRAMDLLRLMKAAGKSWAFNIFSSANAIRKYSYEELVELGISSIWLGLESAEVRVRETGWYRHAAVNARTAGTRNYSARVHHSGTGAPHAGEYFRRDRARRLARDGHAPVHAVHPGSGHARSIARWRSREGCSRMSTWRTYTGRTASISGMQPFRARTSNQVLESAFLRDFERNGPSLFRICRTTLQGWKRYKNHPDLRVRARFHREARMLRHAYAAVLWAMEHRLKNANRSVALQIRRSAPGNRAGVRRAGRRREPRSRSGPLVYEPARRQTARPRRPVRTADDHRSQELGRSVSPA